MKGGCRGRARAAWSMFAPAVALSLLAAAAPLAAATYQVGPSRTVTSLGQLFAANP